MGVITNRVIGNGFINILVNGDLRGQAMPNHPSNITVVNGDIVTWYCGAYIGSSFIKLCDVPQTECVTTVSTTRQINIWQEPFTMTMEASFTDKPLPPPPVNTLSLTVDKSAVNAGDVVTFTASINKPDGTIINLYQHVPLGSDFLIGTGTLQGGYCTITHTFTRDGTEVQYACIPSLLLDCDIQSNLVPVKIGKGTDYVTTALYAVGLLAAAYVAGQYFSNRRK